MHFLTSDVSAGSSAQSLIVDFKIKFLTASSERASNLLKKKTPNCDGSVVLFPSIALDSEIWLMPCVFSIFFMKNLSNHRQFPRERRFFCNGGLAYTIHSIHILLFKELTMPVSSCLALGAWRLLHCNYEETCEN